MKYFKAILLCSVLYICIAANDGCSDSSSTKKYLPQGVVHLGGGNFLVRPGYEENSKLLCDESSYESQETVKPAYTAKDNNGAPKKFGLLVHCSISNNFYNTP